MHTPLPQHLEPFVSKIEARERLTEEERSALRALPQKLVHVSGRGRMVEEGEHPTQCCMVVDGIAYRSKLVRSGRRQIISFHVPGDMVDLQTILFRTADHTIETTRNATVLMIPHEAVLAAAADFPALGRAFWFDTLVDASIQRETLVNVGRRDAFSRTAHLLCELFVRLKRVGMATPERTALTITQADLADALAITAIHMNRVLARLRVERLATLDGRTLAIHDWDRLAEAGEFDPAYLQLQGPEGLHD